MPPRAYAVVLPIALASWLAPFLAGCSGAEDPPAGGATAASAPGGVIRYVTSRIEPASDFKRISEYFTGTENNGGDLVARTDAADRRGLYFIIGLDHCAKLPGGSVATLEFVSSETVEPKKYVFALDALDDAGLFREIRLGVTGKDWPVKPVPQVVAWKITLCQRKPASETIASATNAYPRVAPVLIAGTGVPASSPVGAELVAETGAPFATSQSFLWSLPKKPAPEPTATSGNKP